MIKDLQIGGERGDLLQIVEPRKTFADVILPEKTRRALADTLIQIEKHHLIFETWGFGERHTTGTGLVFNFTGPPGTGKTICAEAVANLLMKRLLSVRYSELESCWAGETSKNLVAVFKEARAKDVVLFFDEADSVAGRRFATTNLGYEREANQGVNVLLKELEYHDGVVIFATNLWTNFDPAFQRRVRTHIVFEMPGPREREMIWQAQLHPTKTPLGADVDFHTLAESFALSGGDIKNAVLKAAHMAAAEGGLDYQKVILQRHFEAAAHSVSEAQDLMQQRQDEVPCADCPAPAVAVALYSLEARVRTLQHETDELRRLLAPGTAHPLPL
jgi:SpoVK/Ycf46/Vps4 family AAA+-type ATPase